MMPCSGEAGGTFARRISSRSASRRASSGRPASSMRSPQLGRARRSGPPRPALCGSPELLAQEVLALRLGHPLAGLGGDLLAQLADGQLVLEQLDEPPQLGVQHVLFQQLLADRPVAAGWWTRRGTRIWRGSSSVSAAGDHLVRQLVHQRHEPTEQVEDGPAQPLGLERPTMASPGRR